MCLCVFCLLYLSFIDLTSFNEFYFLFCFCAVISPPKLEKVLRLQRWLNPSHSCKKPVAKWLSSVSVYHICISLNFMVSFSNCFALDMSGIFIACYAIRFCSLFKAKLCPVVANLQFICYPVKSYLIGHHTTPSYFQSDLSFALRSFFYFEIHIITFLVETLNL